MAKKQEVMISEPLIPDTVSKFLEKGPASLSPDNYVRFFQDLMVTGMSSFNKAIDKASQDEKLRADLFAKLSKEIQQTTESNVALAQSAIDNANKSADSIRKKMDDDNIRPEQFKLCLQELRYYHDSIKDTTRVTQRENGQMVARHQQEEEEIVKKGGFAAYASASLGGLLGGIGLGTLLYRCILRSNNNGHS